jgi:hypothetical protein
MDSSDSNLSANNQPERREHAPREQHLAALAI